jgi:hypothetical protein
VEHHADFAVAVSQPLNVETRADPGDGHGPIQGRVIAVGWWVDPGGAADPGHVPAGTLYLVVDETRPRPMWIKEGDLTRIWIG